MFSARIAVLILASAAVSCGTTQSGPAGPVADALPAAVPARTTELPNWLVGCWSYGEKNKMHQECWEAKDEALVGFGRTFHTNERNKVTPTEQLRIELRDGVLVYIAHPTGSPAPTEFRLESAAMASFRVTNPEHDFPQHIVYRVNGNTLTTAIGGSGKDDVERIWSRDQQCNVAIPGRAKSKKPQEHGITVYSKPAGEVVIDGKPTGQTTPATIKVEPGKHNVTIACPDGQAASTKVVDLEPDTRVKLFIKCKPVEE